MVAFEMQRFNFEIDLIGWFNFGSNKGLNGLMG